MWTVKFNQDTNVDGIGTVSASDETGLYYSRRVDTNKQEDVDKFVTEAKSKVASLASAKSKIDPVEAKVLAALNK